jgi:hypothetical protein
MRKLAKTVIDKWSRTMLNNKINYSKRDEYEQDEQKE